MKLSAFFNQNAIEEENIKYAATKRFVDDNGNPIEWELCSITSDEDEQLRKACTKRVPVPGKKNMFVPETDTNKYLGMLAARCTVYPNLNDAELQNNYGVMGADALLKKMLKPGEYSDLLSKIQEINGFEVTVEEMVDEVKN